MDAIRSLRDDHRNVDAIFKRYRRKAAASERKRLVVDITEALMTHAAIEERELYPLVRQTIPDGDRLAGEAIWEHKGVRDVLSELRNMDPGASGYDHKLKTLIADVRHHVEEEEGQMFPKLREAIGPKGLEDLERRLDRARKTAPKRAPAEPRSVTEKVVDAASAALDQVKGALGSLIEGVNGRTAPRREPTGSKRKNRRPRVARAATTPHRRAAPKK